MAGSDFINEGLTMEYYSFADGEFHFGPNLTKSLKFGCAAQMDDSRIMIIGGKEFIDGGWSATDMVWEFDINTNEYTELASLAQSKHSLACVNLDQKIYVIGLFV